MPGLVGLPSSCPVQDGIVELLNIWLPFEKGAAVAVGKDVVVIWV